MNVVFCFFTENMHRSENKRLKFYGFIVHVLLFFMQKILPNTLWPWISFLESIKLECASTLLSFTLKPQNWN